eukprot:6176117-Pleurochrysis_carterae.AAC.5
MKQVVLGSPLTTAAQVTIKLSGPVITLKYHDANSQAHKTKAFQASTKERHIQLGLVKQQHWDMVCSCGGMSTHNILCAHMFAAAANLRSSQDTICFLNYYPGRRIRPFGNSSVSPPPRSLPGVASWRRCGGSLLSADALDPTLRLTVLKSNASGRPKGLTKMPTSSQKLLQSLRSLSSSLLSSPSPQPGSFLPQHRAPTDEPRFGNAATVAGDSESDRHRVSSSVSVARNKPINEDDTQTGDSMNRHELGQRSRLTDEQEVHQVKHKASFDERTARREQRKLEMLSFAERQKELKQQRREAAAEVGVVNFSGGNKEELYILEEARILARGLALHQLNTERKRGRCHDSARAPQRQLAEPGFSHFATFQLVGGAAAAAAFCRLSPPELVGLSAPSSTGPWCD